MIKHKTKLESRKRLKTPSDKFIIPDRLNKKKQRKKIKRELKHFK